MNDLERELRDLLDRKARDSSVEPTPTRRILKRARRRQVSTVLTAVVATAVLVTGSVAGIRAVLRSEVPPRPATPVLPDAHEGFTSAALPYASIAYPDGWYLLDTSPLVWMGVARPYVAPSGPILQLSNFDPDLPRAPKCMLDPDALPDDGVLLTVGIMTEEEASISTPPSGPWPVDLAPLPSNMDPVCQGSPRIAAWTASSGLIYWATSGHGPGASEADIRAMERAFASLTFPATDQPQMSQMAAFQGQGTPRIVLGTERIGRAIAAIVAYVELNRSFLVGVSSSAGPSDCCLGGAFAPHSGSTVEPVSSSVSITNDGTLVYGVISPEVARAELRTSAGDALPVTIASLPTSLGLEDRVVWGVAPGADERATIVGYDADGNPLGNPSFPLAPGEEIAIGDNDGVPWTLTLTQDNNGWGLEFEHEGRGGGGAGFGDLGGRVFYGAMSSGPSWSIDNGTSTLPRELVGVVTANAARVEYELVGGDVIDASLYRVPEAAFGGGAQVYLLFVPADVLVHAGYVVAYDADGERIGRQYLDFSPVSLFTGVIDGSSAEAVAVMEDLRLAGAAAARYYAEHANSFAGLDPAAASEIAPELVYNTSSTAVAGEVSLRVASAESMVIASVTAGGEVYSACLESGPSASMYGRNDTSDPSACSNGWLDPPG